MDTGMSRSHRKGQLTEPVENHSRVRVATERSRYAGNLIYAVSREYDPASRRYRSLSNATDIYPLQVAYPVQQECPQEYPYDNMTMTYSSASRKTYLFLPPAENVGDDASFVEHEAVHMESGSPHISDSASKSTAPSSWHKRRREPVKPRKVSRGKQSEGASCSSNHQYIKDVLMHKNWQKQYNSIRFQKKQDIMNLRSSFQDEDVTKRDTESAVPIPLQSQPCATTDNQRKRTAYQRVPMLLHPLIEGDQRIYGEITEHRGRRPRITCQRPTESLQEDEYVARVDGNLNRTASRHIREGSRENQLRRDSTEALGPFEGQGLDDELTIGSDFLVNIDICDGGSSALDNKTPIINSSHSIEDCWHMVQDNVAIGSPQHHSCQEQVNDEDTFLSHLQDHISDTSPLRNGETIATQEDDQSRPWLIQSLAARDRSPDWNPVSPQDPASNIMPVGPVFSSGPLCERHRVIRGEGIQNEMMNPSQIPKRCPCLTSSDKHEILLPGRPLSQQGQRAQNVSHDEHSTSHCGGTCAPSENRNDDIARNDNISNLAYSWQFSQCLASSNDQEMLKRILAGHLLLLQDELSQNVARRDSLSSHGQSFCTPGSFSQREGENVARPTHERSQTVPSSKHLEDSVPFVDRALLINILAGKSLPAQDQECQNHSMKRSVLSSRDQASGTPSLFPQREGENAAGPEIDRNQTFRSSQNSEDPVTFMDRHQPRIVVEHPLLAQDQQPQDLSVKRKNLDVHGHDYGTPLAAEQRERKVFARNSWEYSEEYTFPSMDEKHLQRIIETIPSPLLHQESASPSTNTSYLPPRDQDYCTTDLTIQRKEDVISRIIDHAIQNDYSPQHSENSSVDKAQLNLTDDFESASAGEVGNVSILTGSVNKTTFTWQPSEGSVSCLDDHQSRKTFRGVGFLQQNPEIPNQSAQGVIYDKSSESSLRERHNVARVRTVESGHSSEHFPQFMEENRLKRIVAAKCLPGQEQSSLPNPESMLGQQPPSSARNNPITFCRSPPRSPLDPGKHLNAVLQDLTIQLHHQTAKRHPLLPDGLLVQVQDQLAGVRQELASVREHINQELSQRWMTSQSKYQAILSEEVAQFERDLSQIEKDLDTFENNCCAFERELFALSGLEKMRLPHDASGSSQPMDTVMLNLMARFEQLKKTLPELWSQNMADRSDRQVAEPPGNVSTKPGPKEQVVDIVKGIENRLSKLECGVLSLKNELCNIGHTIKSSISLCNGVALPTVENVHWQPACCQDHEGVAQFQFDATQIGQNPETRQNVPLPQINSSMPPRTPQNVPCRTLPSHNSDIERVLSIEVVPAIPPDRDCCAKHNSPPANGPQEIMEALMAFARSDDLVNRMKAVIHQEIRAESEPHQIRQQCSELEHFKDTSSQMLDALRDMVKEMSKNKEEIAKISEQMSKQLQARCPDGAVVNWNALDRLETNILDVVHTLSRAKPANAAQPSGHTCGRSEQAFKNVAQELVQGAVPGSTDKSAHTYFYGQLPEGQCQQDMEARLQIAERELAQTIQEQAHVHEIENNVRCFIE